MDQETTYKTVPVDYDPGLTQRYIGRLRRIINKDGSFNVRKRGVGLRDKGFYLHMMTASWPWFLLQIGIGYTLVNVLFACVYYAIGVEALTGTARATPGEAFLSALFFSVQTFTTVGYGHVWPNGTLANLVAAFEALSGLLALALGTGMVYGRFSRPSAKLAFSPRMVVAPFHDGRALMFRIANRRPNVLMESEARVILMTVEPGDELRRRYQPLTLDRDKILFLALTWTLVHVIDERSPLYGMTAEMLAERQAEVLILIKVFDDTFGQVVHARHSYTWDELEWGARFMPAFRASAEGEFELDLERLGDIERE